MRAADGRPLAAGVRLQVERPELVDADHHRRIIVTRFDLAVGDVVQLEDPVLLDFEVGVVGLLPRLHRLKRHALLTEQDPQALMADVVDHPLSDEMLGQLGQRPLSRTAGRDRSVGPARYCLIRRRCGSVNVGGRPPAYRGCSESNPSALRLWITGADSVVGGERQRGRPVVEDGRRPSVRSIASWKSDTALSRGLMNG